MNKTIIKDVALAVVFLLIVGAAVLSHFMKNGLDDIGGMIEQVLLIVLALGTLVDISSHIGFSPLVPSFIEKHKEKTYIRERQEYIREDIKFFKDYNEERIGYILSQLGIRMDQFDKIRLELIKMRCLPLKSIEDAKEKIKILVTSDYPIVINQDKFDSSKINYKKVKYYINIMDIMFYTDYARELSSILAFLIQEESDLPKIDKLVIPYDSNFLLGFEVGRQLGKPVVKIRPKDGKIVKEQCWDGDLKITDRVIIIHDVLVSGEQIIDTIQKIPKSCTVLGLFCMIVRKGGKGKEKIEKMGVPCHRVIELNDEIIHKLRKKNSNK